MNKTVKVCAAAIMDGDRVLIARRAPAEKMAGGWEFPGGKIKAGETPKECVSREITEELAVEIEVLNFCINVKQSYGDFNLDMDVYYCRIKKGFIDMMVHDQYAWVPVEKLLSYNLLPADIMVAEKIIEDNL
ncbi:MAG TPA: (deoxy)nucleoside triphosphate pyrophosphohydrolase [Clostridia bacterium]|mgnify:CR=1 FL=1|jgi:8-oxo-dGTP diphosphatase|nr:(deoxy)nucleoside triphosphate pyrophosphohydrolase [Clostridia bacterium]